MISPQDERKIAMAIDAAHRRAVRMEGLGHEDAQTFVDLLTDELCRVLAWGNPKFDPQRFRALLKPVSPP